jgi:hypothetical protein
MGKSKIYSEHGKVKGEKRKHARGYACGEEKDGCWYNRGQTDSYKQQKGTKVAWVSRGYPNNFSALSTLTSFEPGRLFFTRKASIENALTDPTSIESWVKCGQYNVLQHS